MLTYNPDKLGLPVKRVRAQIPHDEWFRLRVSLRIGADASGAVRMWVNGARVLHARTPTIRSGMAGYTTAQAGITARLERPYELLMDNFALVKSRSRGVGRG